jgi:hypothetical protein
VPIPPTAHGRRAAEPGGTPQKADKDIDKLRFDAFGTRIATNKKVIRPAKRKPT